MKWPHTKTLFSQIGGMWCDFSWVGVAFCILISPILLLAFIFEFTYRLNKDVDEDIREQRARTDREVEDILMGRKKWESTLWTLWRLQSMGIGGPCLVVNRYGSRHTTVRLWGYQVTKIDEEKKKKMTPRELEFLAIRREHRRVDRIVWRKIKTKRKLQNQANQTGPGRRRRWQESQLYSTWSGSL